ncbi:MULTISPECIES: MobH family relaxase [unclassified Pseudomonas]|uniref:MobH family relaxase n=1 Tax=unclassified Pseudomonas TaxID=196821 RepID=UPI0025FA56C5|nr:MULTISPECIES: MobH family relaxase [unclassified Pseudomonas]
MRHWWRIHSKGKAVPPEPETIVDGIFLPQPAEILLDVKHRKRLLERIWQYTALTPSQFDRLYLDPIRRYASYVQLLPASETHHHAYPGGMLDHGLELMACSLKLRQSHLLPSGSAPEDQAAQTDAWSAAIAYGALLHDIGKIAVDIHVEYDDGEVWHPWQGPLDQPYRFRYNAGRNYHLHGAATGLLYTQILMPPLLDWLSGYPELWGRLLFLLANHYDLAGKLGELVQQADRISTAQNIGANPLKALQAPAHSLQHHLLMGLRHLVKNDLKLNQPGAAGWLTEEHLWLVSKTVTDKLRIYLLAQAVDGVPSSNLAMFDELQSHGLVEATPEGKAIWSAKVSSAGWQQRFTFLRLQPSLIWADQNRPQFFTGTVELAASDDGQPSELNEFRHNDQSAHTEPKPEQKTSVQPLGQHYAHLDDLMDMVDEKIEIEDKPAPHRLPPSCDSPSDGPGQPFVQWLREGIRNHSLLINDSKAKIHTVNGTFFLVTPGIFQHYVADHLKAADTHQKPDAWRKHQRHFERLGLHEKRPDGQNIWTCKVQGPRRTGSLNGYMLKNARAVLGEPTPDNPFLTLIQ